MLSGLNSLATPGSCVSGNVTSDVHDSGNVQISVAEALAVLVNEPEASMATLAWMVQLSDPPTGRLGIVAFKAPEPLVAGQLTPPAAEQVQLKPLRLAGTGSLTCTLANGTLPVLATSTTYSTAPPGTRKVSVLVFRIESAGVRAAMSVLVLAPLLLTSVSTTPAGTTTIAVFTMPCPITPALAWRIKVQLPPGSNIAMLPESVLPLSWYAPNVHSGAELPSALTIDRPENWLGTTSLKTALATCEGPLLLMTIWNWITSPCSSASGRSWNGPLLPARCCLLIRRSAFSGIGSIAQPGLGVMSPEHSLTLAGVTPSTGNNPLSPPPPTCARLTSGLAASESTVTL